MGSIKKEFWLALQVALVKILLLDRMLIQDVHSDQGTEVSYEETFTPIVPSFLTLLPKSNFFDENNF